MLNIRRIIVPIDFQRHTEDITEFAINMAKKMDAIQTFVHVVEYFAKVASYSDLYPVSFIEVDTELFDHAQKKMTALLEQYKASCPGCAGVVLRGGAAETIVAFGKEQQADLIIMGTHGAHGIEKILLGSVAERVLKNASCPILIFNPYKGDRGF